MPEGGSLACLLEPAPDTDNVAYRLIHALDEHYGDLLRGEVRALEASWAGYLGVLGKDVHIEQHGERNCEGRVRALTFDSIDIEVSGAGVIGIAPERIKHMQPARGAHEAE